MLGGSSPLGATSELRPETREGPGFRVYRGSLKGLGRREGQSAKS